jgi:hypothetical protein
MTKKAWNRAGGHTTRAQTPTQDREELAVIQRDGGIGDTLAGDDANKKADFHDACSSPMESKKIKKMNRSILWCSLLMRHTP